jgi:hypothetical protein
LPRAVRGLKARAWPSIGDRLRVAARLAHISAVRAADDEGVAEADAGQRGLDGRAKPTPALLKKLAGLGADASRVPRCSADGRQGRGAVLRQRRARARRWPTACRRR